MSISQEVIRSIVNLYQAIIGEVCEGMTDQHYLVQVVGLVESVASVINDKRIYRKES